MKAAEVLDLLNRNEIDKLRNLCINEIFTANSAKADAVKARTRLANKIAKTVKKERPALAGAYEIDGKQMLCDGYIGAMYNDIIPGLPQPEQPGGADMRKIIPYRSARKELEIKIDIDELKKRLKVIKAQNPNHSKKDTWLVKIDQAYYDIDLMLDLIPTLSGDLRISRADNPPSNPKYAMLVIEGENGIGVILPMRPLKDEESIEADVVKDYNKDTNFWEESYYA